MITTNLLLNASTQPSLISHKSNQIQVWLVGFPLAIMVMLSCDVALFVLPAIRRFPRAFIYVMKFLVALAVGALIATALLYLIPEAFGLNLIPGHEGYIWRSCAIAAGLYLFLLLENFVDFLMRLKKLLLSRSAMHAREASVRHSIANGKCSLPVAAPAARSTGLCALVYMACFTDEHTALEAEDEGVNMDEVALEAAAAERYRAQQMYSIESNASNAENNLIFQNCVVEYNEALLKRATKHPKESEQKPLTVASVAYLLLAANVLHTLVDGLAIGAGFASNVSTGVGLAVACIVEEVPHQLGDFAVLVHAGMGIWRTAFAKLLAASPALLGYVVGALAGEFTRAERWIFSIASGMFLYISLCALLPELRGQGHSESESSSSDGDESDSGLHSTPGQSQSQHCEGTNHSASATASTRPQRKTRRRMRRARDVLEFPALATFLQHAGLFIGFGVLLLLALFSSHIEALF